MKPQRNHDKRSWYGLFFLIGGEEMTLYCKHVYIKINKRVYYEVEQKFYVIFKALRRDF